MFQNSVQVRKSNLRIQVEVTAVYTYLQLLRQQLQINQSICHRTAQVPAQVAIDHWYWSQSIGGTGAPENMEWMGH